MKILNLKSVILLEYQNLKTIFAKRYVTTWSEEVFVIKKTKNTIPGHILLVILNVKKFLDRFAKKN